jgi:xylulokinase
MVDYRDLFIGVDSGTQGTKAVLVNGETGGVVSKSTRFYGLIEGLPPGHMEQHPRTWVEAMFLAMKDVLGLSGLDKTRVRAVGISAQQHGFVPLDSDGKVIRPAKLWNDTSTTDECTNLIESLGGIKHVIELIGNGIPPGFTVSKILWMRNHEPENYSKLRHVLLPHNYLNYILTGVYSMEFGDASGTALMDVVNRRWRKEIIEAVDPSLHLMLPELRPNDEPVGFIKKDVAEALGLPDDTLVSSGGGDNMMGAIGTGNTSQGKVTVSLGTSGTVYAYSDSPMIDLDGEVAAFCDSTNGWLPLICTMNVTVATEMVRKLLCMNYSEFEDSVSNSPLGGGGIIFLPYLTGERVPNLPHGRGVYYGLTIGNFSRDELVRSTVEGVTLGLNYGLNKMRKLGIDPEEIRLTGGGARSKTWRRIAADVFDADIVTLCEEEGAAFGAAIQALWCYRLQQGEKVTISEITEALVKIDESSRVRPIKSNVEAYERFQASHNELSITLRGLFKPTTTVNALSIDG